MSYSTSRAPSDIIEYGFYAVIAYGMLAEVFGISIPIIGAAVLAGLTILCIMHVGQRIPGVYRPIVLALACGVSILLIQLSFHGESILQSDMRQTIIWLFLLIVIQTLSCKKGFLHRFAIAAFVIGCATLPFIKTYVETEEMVRIGIQGSGLSNPNALAMWFGFCFVYFVVAGLEARNYLVRTATWSGALLSLYVVAITVSRGPLLAMAIATVLALQKTLKRSFLPILAILIIAWFIYLSGVFDNLINYYLVRGDEDTGRTYIWSEASRRFLNSIMTGEGFSNALISFPGSRYETGPHNVFLYFGLSSGVVPLIFFLSYLFRSLQCVMNIRLKQTVDAPFLLPLSIYACLEMMLLSQVYMTHWTISVFSIAGASGYVTRSPLRRRKKMTDFRKQRKTGEVPASLHAQA